jgi:DNA-directed RNA polymerase alpha subunit
VEPRKLTECLYPTPGLPDDTVIGSLRLSTRIRNALDAAGIKTVGEVQEASDKTLLSLQDLGHGSVAHLRETLGPLRLKAEGK